MKRRGIWTGLAAATILGLGALAASFASTTAEAGWFGHGRGLHHGEVDPEDVRDGVAWLLRGVEASDEQVERITAIALEALEDLRESHPDREATHAALTRALVGDSVDRAALEATRAEMLQSFTALSERMTVAIADAAEVLTPAQRAELAARHEERRARHRWH